MAATVKARSPTVDIMGSTYAYSQFDDKVERMQLQYKSKNITRDFLKYFSNWVRLSLYTPSYDDDDMV